MQQKLILIDGYGFVFRAYHSLPPLTNPKGVFVGAVYGFTNMLFKTIKDHPNDKIIVVLDSGQKSFRNEIYPEYKANRPPAPEDLKQQFPIIRDAAAAFNLTILEEQGLEADDLIASLTYKAEQHNLPVTIFSSDKDLMQLIRGNINMYDPMKNKLIGRNEVVDKFGIRPDQVCDYLALIGDSSDNIPGVKGVGAKTALDLLTEFGSLDNIYNSLDKIAKDRIKNLLAENKANAYLSKQLINLTNPPETAINLEQITAPKFNGETLGEFLSTHGFSSLKAKISAFFDVALEQKPIVNNNAPNTALVKITQENFKALAKLHDLEKIGIFYLNIKQNGLVVILSSVCNYYYLDEAKDEPDTLFTTADNLLVDIKQFIETAVKNPALRLVTSDLKRLLHHVEANIVDINQHYNLIDLDLIEYLLPLTGEQKLSAKLHNLSKADNLDINEIVALLSEHYHSLEHYLSRLQSNNLMSIYHDLDHKINLILYQMEQVGIAVSSDRLQTLSYEFAKEIHNLEQSIYQQAGLEFNIASPKQLGEILFDKLQIESDKKTSKTKSRSTSQEVLEELQNQGYEIAGLVLAWRHFAKLKSTYTDSLPKNINTRTGRIHTVFNNVLTSTGRLSSSNPNLQNIPIRTMEGDKIRSCFIAKPGYSLIAADYSQIELRLLAHIADVKLLKQAFNNNKDIHIATAAEMFEVAEDQVTSEMRRQAKQINFGIIYGISSYGLATRLNIKLSRAKDFIEKYFNKYPEIKTYIHDVVAGCRQAGYVETIIGRKLYFPNINVSTPALKAVIERAVINAPIQGSASDIIKKSMVDIESNKKYQQLNANLLLQVHDELIFEVTENNKEQLLQLAKSAMEGTMKLSIPLIVNCGAGNNWQEIKS